MSIIDAGAGVAKKVIKFCKVNAPVIGLVAGSAAVVVGTVLACKATLEVDDILTEHAEQMSRIKKGVEVSDGKYTEESKKRDTIKVYSATFGRFAKAYGPSALLYAAGFASIFAGFGCLNSRYGVALTSVAALDKKFGEYRTKVVEKFGAEVDQELAGLKLPTQKLEADELVNEETGETKTEEYNVVTIKDIEENDFIMCFEKYTWNHVTQQKELNPVWEKGGYTFNENTIVQAGINLTRRLQMRLIDAVRMNQAIEALGGKCSSAGHWYGWTSAPGASVRINYTPYIKRYNDEYEDVQFPCMELIDINDPDARQRFVNQYIDDDSMVGYLIEFDVDKDENGIPVMISEELY